MDADIRVEDKREATVVENSDENCIDLVTCSPEQSSGSIIAGKLQPKNSKQYDC